MQEKQHTQAPTPRRAGETARFRRVNIHAVPNEPPRAPNTPKVHRKRAHIDFSILIIILVLIGYGLLLLFSASFVYGQKREGDGYYYLFMQLRGVVLGGVLMIFFTIVDYRFWRRHYKLVYLGCLILVAIVFVPGLSRGEDGINGAQRWINIPGLNMSLQPAEIVKFALVVFTAALIDALGEKNMYSFKKGILPVVGLVGAVDFIILVQPNFSMFTIIALTTFIMLILGGMRGTHLGILTCTGALGGFIVMTAASYRVTRLQIFLDPFSEALSQQAYQLRQSLYAIGAGGWFGQGLGMSRQKYLFLPFGESDFIFSIIAEELGFVWTVVLISLFLLLLWRGYRVAWKCKDTFGRLVAAGISTVFALQAFINIGVATSSIPTTGVPLPFISYGSTAMMAFMAAAGILLNVSKHTTDLE